MILNLFLVLGSMFFALQIGNDIASKMNRKKRIEEALRLAKLVCPPMPQETEEKIDKAIEDYLKDER